MMMPDSVRPETTLDRSRSREKRRAAGDGFVKEEAVVNRAGRTRDPSAWEDPEGGVPRSDAQRRSGAKRRWEGGTTRVPGDGGARGTERARAGRNSTSSQTARSSCLRKAGHEDLWDRI